MKKQISYIISIAAMTVICLFAFSAYAEESQQVMISDANTVVSTYFDAYDYAGKAISPALTVIVDGKRLAKDVDYRVEYSDNLNVGTAKATVIGIGNYSGSYVKTYPIIPISNANALTYSINNYNAYNGKNQEPAVTAVFRGATLAKGKDFTVSYSANKNIGEAKAVVKGIGNFSFTKTLTFKIVAPSVTGLKFSNETNAITLKWNKMNNVSGYQILAYDYSKNAYKTVKFVSAGTTSYKITGLAASSLYKYCVRAYNEIGGKTYYGMPSADLMTRTRSQNTYITSLAQNGSSITLKWKTVQGAGYVIRYATKSDFSNVKEIFVNNSHTGEYTIKNVNKNASYYVQIASFTTLDNTKYYSARSRALSTSCSKRIAYFSSYYVNNPNRTTNMRLAAQAINGTVIQPGETFSFNKIVGQRTYAKGYKDAPVFTGGNNVENGVGGGICQVASTIFNTALYANMQIVERSQHSQRVTYVPLGRDAAISWGSQDFKFKNNSPYPIKIVVTVSNGVNECEFLTSPSASIPSVSLPVSQNGKNFTLRRYANGSCNYVTYSNY